MSRLIDIPFEKEPENVKDAVQAYWTERSGGFADLRRQELNSPKADLWKQEILACLDGHELKNADILDVGCGSGFFEVLFGKDVRSITGIDLTEKMIEQAEKAIQDAGISSAKALQMDAEQLSFPDESFDVILSRNLTWTLPHPVNAYGEWYRVLKKGGVLINFDAEYAKDAHNPDMSHNEAHQNIDPDLYEKCHAIYHMLTISTLSRPQWDEQVLKKTGFTSVETDLNVSDRIYFEEDSFHIPDRVFRIRAVK